MFDSDYAREQVFCRANNNEMKSRYRRTDGHLKSITTVVYSNISQTTEILSRSKRRRLQPTYTVTDGIFDHLVV